MKQWAQWSNPTMGGQQFDSVHWQFSELLLSIHIVFEREKIKVGEKEAEMTLLAL